MSPFQPSFAFHIETCYLVCNASQTTAFCMECNTGRKGVDYIQFLPLRGAGGAGGSFKGKRVRQDLKRFFQVRIFIRWIRSTVAWYFYLMNHRPEKDLNYFIRRNWFFTCVTVNISGNNNCVKVFKNGPSKICGRKPLKNLNFLKAVFYKFYLVHSWIPWP